ncbi:MAG: hypothetical protein ACFFG0_27755 [Candidatus Thorarchaeota archaeon]
MIIEFIGGPLDGLKEDVPKLEISIDDPCFVFYTKPNFSIYKFSEDKFYFMKTKTVEQLAKEGKG